MAATRKSTPSSISKARHRRKMRDLTLVAERKLEEMSPFFDDYVRLHRLLYGCDPDTEEVSGPYDPDVS